MDGALRGDRRGAAPGDPQRRVRRRRPLPSETELAARCAASRGTVRQAVAPARPEGLIGSRQGARRIVLRQRAQPELRRAAQLRPVGAGDGLPGRPAASCTGRRRPATAEEARPARPARRVRVLDVLRLRCSTASRCCWSGRSTPTGSPRPSRRCRTDCVSVTDSARRHGRLFAYGEHLIDAVAAGARTPGCCRVRRGSPLLRQRRVTPPRGPPGGVVRRPLPGGQRDLQRPQLGGRHPWSGIRGRC